MHMNIGINKINANGRIINLFSRTALWILMKIGKDKLHMVPYKRGFNSSRSAKWWIQSGQE